MATVYKIHPRSASPASATAPSLHRSGAHRRRAEPDRRIQGRAVPRQAAGGAIPHLCPPRRRHGGGDHRRRGRDHVDRAPRQQQGRQSRARQHGIGGRPDDRSRNAHAQRAEPAAAVRQRRRSSSPARRSRPYRSARSAAIAENHLLVLGGFGNRARLRERRWTAISGPATTGTTTCPTARSRRQSSSAPTNPRPRWSAPG